MKIEFNNVELMLLQSIVFEHITDKAVQFMLKETNLSTAELLRLSDLEHKLTKYCDIMLMQEFKEINSAPIALSSETR